MRNREQAAQIAEATHHNIVNTCQLTVRNWLDAPSAGDLDKDGAADAEDGWKSEPVSARHYDKKGKRGCPGSFLGGSSDHGHRVLGLGDGLYRSTDFNGETKRWDPGTVGTGTADEIAAALGVTWAGWSDTMDSMKIPDPPKPVTRVTQGRELFREARDIAKTKKQWLRVTRLTAALKAAPWK